MLRHINYYLHKRTLFHDEADRPGDHQQADPG